MRPDLSALVDMVEGGINELRTECRSAGPLVPSERVSAAHLLAGVAAALASLRRIFDGADARRGEELGRRAATGPAPVHSCECACDSCQAAGAGYFAQRAALCGDTSAAQRLNPAVYAALTARGTR